VNRHLIEGMARAGMGEPFVVLNPAEGRKQAARFRKYIESPVLTDIGVAFSGLEAYDVEPIAIPDLFAHRPVVVFGKYKGAPSGTVTVTGHTATGEFRNTIPVTAEAASDDNAALRLLWARHRIMRLADASMISGDKKIIEEVTGLGLKYSLMTQFTSFVAVDKIKRADGKLVTVKQPLPMPEGVPDMAVGSDKLNRSSKLMAPPPPASTGYGAVTADASTAPAGGMSTEKEVEESAGEFKAGRVVIRIESVRGGLSKSEVMKTLRMKQRLFDDCYRKAVSARKKPIKGEVVFRIVFDSAGKVKSISQTSTTINDAATELCLRTVLLHMTFPSVVNDGAEAIVKLSGG
jgi:Ca-activated chloride channel family protein